MLHIRIKIYLQSLASQQHLYKYILQLGHQIHTELLRHR